MTGSAIFAIDAENHDIAASAAHWLPGFYPRVAVTVRGDAIELRSEWHNSEALAAIWTSAFANELLKERAQARRVAAMSALMQ